MGGDIILNKWICGLHTAFLDSTENKTTKLTYDCLVHGVVQEVVRETSHGL